MIAAESPVLLGFGGVAAVGRSGAVDLGGLKQRAVLALLMLEPGAVVPLERMVDLIWAGAPPARAEVSVRGYVSNLRKALVAAGLGPDGIVFRDRGYLLKVAPEIVDLHRFEALVEAAGRLERPSGLVAARGLLMQALELYAGPPLGALAEELGLVDVTTRFEERRGEAVEALMEVRLALGEHVQLPAAGQRSRGRSPTRPSHSSMPRPTPSPSPRG